MSRGDSSSEYEHLLVQRFDDGAITRILLNRPEKRNAQNRALLVELNHALLAAEADDDVRVVILGGTGPVFSAGHDVSPGEVDPALFTHSTRRDIHGGRRSGAENLWLQEWHYFFQNTLRWRNLRKVTIAQVHGSVFAAGLMLMWACDLIVAAEGTEFADVVATRFGMMGVEYFAHPWEFGSRKAKELLLTGDSLAVEDAYRMGMVAKVFPPDQLAEKTLDFARRIAATPTMAALLVKEAVNQAQDSMGFTTSLNAAFSIHLLNHSHWASITNGRCWAAQPEHGVPDFRHAPPPRPASRSEPVAPAVAESPKSNGH